MIHREFPTVLQALVLALLMVALQLLLGTIIGAFLITPDPAASNSLLTAAANVLAFGLVIFISLNRSSLDPGRALRTFDFSLLFIGSLVVTVLGLQVLLSELDNLFRHVLPMPRELARFFAQLLSDRNVPVSALLLVVVAPLTEETLFRGIFLHGFLANYSTGPAVVLSALFFAVLHLNPWQFFGAFFLGLYLALLYVWTRSLSACILGHALANGLPLVFIHLLGLRIPGFTAGFEQQAFQPYWLDLAGAGALAAGVLLTILYLRSRRGPAGREKETM
jgi:membrane protease YdiL (CAAX protease family)